MTRALRSLLRTAHRWLGLSLAFFVLFLSVTGLALNHGETWQLDKKTIPSWLASLYIETPDLTGFKVTEGLVYQAGHTLYLNEHAVTSCSETLIGAAEISGLIITACEGELLAFLGSGQLVERLGAAHGVPSPITRLAMNPHMEGAFVFVGNDEGWYRYNMEELSSESILVSDESMMQASPAEIPANLALGGAITWERLILDLHAGRWPGFSSTWFLDAVAGLLIVLALSGIGIYFRPQR
jgi:hypothetical protein